MSYWVVELAARLQQLDGTGSPIDPEEVRRRADDVLSGAEYDVAGPSFLDRILGWLGDRLADAVFQSGGDGIFLRLLFNALFYGVLILIGWVIYKSIRLPGPSRTTVAESVVYGTENVRGPEVWMAEADRLAAAGDFRGALRCRHQALVASWIVGDVIAHIVGQTARECHDVALAQADIDPSVSARVVDEFNAVWYGKADVDAADYSRFSSACASIAAENKGRRSRVGTSS